MVSKLTSLTEDSRSSGIESISILSKRELETPTMLKAELLESFSVAISALSKNKVPKLG